MSELTEEEIVKLTHLCRIRCSEQERALLKENISKILLYISQLQEINTQEVPPCIHIIEPAASVTREDLVGETLRREEFLSNAPSHVGGMVKVPPIIKSSS